MRNPIVNNYTSLSFMILKLRINKISSNKQSVRIGPKLI